MMPRIIVIILSIHTCLISRASCCCRDGHHCNTNTNS